MKPNKKLEALYDLLTQEFINQIKDGDDVKPATLNAARQFLKDNNITNELAKGSPLEELDSLINEDEPLPFPERQAS